MSITSGVIQHDHDATAKVEEAAEMAVRATTCLQLGGVDAPRMREIAGTYDVQCQDAQCDTSRTSLANAVVIGLDRTKLEGGSECIVDGLMGSDRSCREQGVFNRLILSVRPSPNKD